MCHEASARWVPLVLAAAEGGDLDWPRKARSRIGLPRKRSAKRNPNAVSVLLIAIDDQQRPFAIRTLQSISGNKFAAGAVVDIGFGRIDLMLSPAGLSPFQVDKLRNKELRQWLLNFVGSIHREHTESARRTVASGLHLQGQIVEVINALGPRVE